MVTGTGPSKTMPESVSNVADMDPALSSETTPLLKNKKEQYSVFSSGQKKFIIFVAALASTFSPFSSNIYYPAINSIADDLHIGPEMVNLTITAYMVSKFFYP